MKYATKTATVRAIMAGASGTNSNSEFPNERYGKAKQTTPVASDE